MWLCYGAILKYDLFDTFKANIPVYFELSGDSSSLR